MIVILMVIGMFYVIYLKDKTYEESKKREMLRAQRRHNAQIIFKTKLNKWYHEELEKIIKIKEFSMTFTEYLNLTCWTREELDSKRKYYEKYPIEFIQFLNALEERKRKQREAKRRAELLERFNFISKIRDYLNKKKLDQS